MSPLEQGWSLRSHEGPSLTDQLRHYCNTLEKTPPEQLACCRYPPKYPWHVQVRLVFSLNSVARTAIPKHIPQYRLDTPEGDVAMVKRTLGRVSSPAILVGHSYGGSVITAAGTDDRVVGLVYIAALAPDADETSQSQQEKCPVTDVFKYVELAEGHLWIRPEGATCFAGDLPEQEQKLVWATYNAPAADLFSRNAPGVAWKSKPSWYIVANNDRTVQPELERFLAKRMRASIHAVDSSHVPMLSHPGFVIDVIRAAAKAVQGSSARA